MNNSNRNPAAGRPAGDEFDEGGLRAPPELHGWRKAWWWFDFIILVKLARLRFVGILLVIGLVITKWDTLAAYYERWTRPSATDATAAGKDVEWFCPMHPAVVRPDDKEKCPVCFMPLSKRKKGSGHAEPLPAGVVNRVQLSPYRVVLAGVQTAAVDYHVLEKEITAVGFVEFNERGQRTVSARVAGRIDKLFANETGQMVKAGDELAQLYSPELLTTVQNLLDAKRRGSQDYLEAARSRLQLLGIDDEQIEELLKKGKAEPQLTVRSPIGGHVINKFVREGQYVQEGTALYDVADLSTVWIQAQIYEDDLAFLPPGYEHGAARAGVEPLEAVATVRSLPDEQFRGTLAFIYPHVDQDTRTVTVRFELKNPEHKLRPGTTASVTLRVPAKSVQFLKDAVEDEHAREMLAESKVLAVPESAVIDTGAQRIVYRESEPGTYEGVSVSLGPKMTSDSVTYYPILTGLIAGERIVLGGAFLVDAETRLNPAAGSIYFGGTGGSKAPEATSTTNVVPSTPDEPEAKITAALAKLSPDDRKLAEAQRYCPVLKNNRLGVMGTPVKLIVLGKPVFVCCSACKQKALDHPEDTLKAATSGQRQSSQAAKSINSDKKSANDKAEAEISAALATLSADDLKLARRQRYCPVLKDSRLGSMGPPVKIMIDGQPVLLCCEGCAPDADAKPKEVLAKAKQLQAGERNDRAHH